MTLKEIRMFHGKEETPDMREVARMRHPLLLFEKDKMMASMRQRGMSQEESDERIDLLMMLHPNKRIARMATPTMVLTARQIENVLQETRGGL